jgi:hypothetical protein
MKSEHPSVQDLLSQAALRKPPPRTDPGFLRAWEGLSVFADLADVQRLGRQRRWRIGEFIAVLSIPDDAPITYGEPEVEGSSHWLLYDTNGQMLDEHSAAYLLTCIVSMIHGPSSVT